LQYQIGRCSGPCVNKISEEDYQQDLQHTLLFLEGKSTDVGQMLSEKMEHSAQAQDYEKAAKIRDEISKKES
jgi:excinuclease ABC subunit C